MSSFKYSCSIRLSIHVLYVMVSSHYKYGILNGYYFFVKWLLSVYFLSKFSVTSKILKQNGKYSHNPKYQVPLVLATVTWIFW